MPSSAVRDRPWKSFADNTIELVWCVIGGGETPGKPLYHRSASLPNVNTSASYMRQGEVTHEESIISEFAQSRLCRKE